MSAGETGGIDLTVETLAFINDNWSTEAATFSRSSGWVQPVLRNHDNKTLYPSGSVTNYTAQLRQNDVVTVENGGRNDEVTGPDFDFDVAWELDVRCEAMPGNGFSVIEDSTDWNVFVAIVRRAILSQRKHPITDPECKFDWRWLECVNQSPIPGTEDNRNHYGSEFTCIYYGYESLP